MSRRWAAAGAALAATEAFFGGGASVPFSRLLLVAAVFVGLETFGVVVGYAYAAQYRPRPAYRFAVENSLYVDKDWVGQGIGRQLLTALVETCRKTGIKQMIAGIGGDNPASIALHLGLGFKHVGVLQNVGFKFDRWRDVTLMQKAL